MKKLIYSFAVCLMVLELPSQNLVPIIIKKDLIINKIDNKVDLTFDVIDPDNDDLEIQCKIYNLSVDKKYEEIVPQKIDGDIGFPVKQGLNKTMSIYFDFASNTSNLVIVLSALDREPIDVNAILSRVSPTRLQDHLIQIQGKRNTSDPVKYNASRAYIKDQVEGYLNVDALQFTNTQYTCINYESTKLGHSKPSNIIVMDAHYDSVPVSPGADDNGSGVCGVLEAVRILSEYTFKKSIRFLFFDLEELGLVGSTIYASSQLSNRDSIQAVLNYEMIGYYSDVPNSQSFPTGFNFLFPDAYNEVVANNSKGDFITNVANTTSSALKTSFQTNANTYVPNLKVISLEVPGNGSIAPDLTRSDHAVFWYKNIPAIMITDGANFRNKNYHTTKDSISYLNFDFMTNVVKAAMATMIDLAGIEHGVSVELPVDLTTFTNNLNTNIFYASYQKDNILIKSKINLPNAKIEMVDVNGHSVCTEKCNLQTDVLSKFHCPGLPAGIYYIVVYSPEGNQTQKIFVNGF